MDAVSVPLLGLALVLGSVGLIWYFLPRRGRARLWNELPFLQSMIPLAAVSGLAICGAMMFSVLAR